MENGHVDNTQSWTNTAVVTKFNTFAAIAKLRLFDSPRELLRKTCGVDDLSTLLTDDVQLNEVSYEILQWLRQEVCESVAFLYMSEGVVLPEANVEFDKTNDVYTYSTGNSLTTAEKRLRFALETMKLLAACEKFAKKSRILWSDALNLAKNVDDGKYSTSVDEISRLVGLDDAETSKEVTKSLFRENDDVFVLQHGFAGYMDALDRVLRKIGGREWDIQVLDVLERRAAMIADFSQIRYLVDSLPDVHSMVDMRIQQSLNRIFKTAFANLQFSVKKQVLNYYYQKYNTWNTAEMDPSYGTELNLLINNLAQGASKITYRTFAIKMCWHFMLSAKQCWWRLLNAVITLPALIQPIIEILRVMPPVVTLRLPEKNNNRLILEGCARLVEQNVLTNEDQETAWTNFVVHLCNGAPKKTVLEATEIVGSFLSPMLPAQPALILNTFQKIFDDKTTKIDWKTADFKSGEEEGKNRSIDNQGVDATRLFASIFRIFARATRPDHSDNASNLEVRTLCPATLNALARRWRSDHVTLSIDAIDFLRSQTAALPWVHQLFAMWLLRDCCADKSDLIECPRCLIDTFQLPLEKYSAMENCPTSGDNHSPIDCALRSILEAACFSSDMAKIFLADGKIDRLLEISRSKLKLRDYLMFAVKNALAERRLNEWKNVLIFLNEFFDRFYEKEIADSLVAASEMDFFVGLKFVAPVTLLADVAVVLLKNESERRPDAVKSWLQNFYSVTRDYQTSVSEKLSANNLARETALRQIWNACVVLLKTFNKQTPRQLEWLLVGVNEAYRRASIRFTRDMVDDVTPHVTPEVSTMLAKNLDVCKPLLGPDDVTPPSTSPLKDG